MEPFEKHQADLGGLREAASGMLTDASRAGDLSGLTTNSYQPVIGNWAGMGAAEAQAAPQPLQSGSGEASGALAWASVVAEFWAGKVETFNNEVDRIVERFNGMGPHYGLTGDPSDDEIADARAEALSRARNEWWQAYNTHILDGEDQAVSMLADGPTESGLDTLREWASDLWAGLGPLATGAGELLKGHFRWWSSFHLAEHGHFLGRVIAPGLMAMSDGVRMLMTDPYYREVTLPRMVRNSYQNHLSESGKLRWATWAGRLLPGVSGGIAAWDQWSADSDRSTEERITRAAVVGVAAGLGDAAGSVAGAALTGPLAPVGAAVGGMAGGRAGSELGESYIEGADHITDATREGGRSAGLAAMAGAGAGSFVDQVNTVGTVTHAVTNPATLTPWVDTPQIDSDAVRDHVTDAGEAVGEKLTEEPAEYDSPGPGPRTL